jgi:hypothetical protein
MLDYQPGKIREISGDVGHLCPRSQRPHIWLYPASSQGGVLELPFVYKQNWLRLISRSEVQNMGEINIRSVSLLKNANNIAGTGATIRVYAWATNVKLSGPTYSAALQSGDEYQDEKGPISKVASAVADAANALTVIPVISPFATATNIAATAVGSIASLFGWTNVPNIAASHPFKSQPFHAMASPEISTCVEKLTLDPKNELTVDPRVCGLEGDDELLITKFCERESFIGYTNWLSVDPVDHQLMNVLVHPFMQILDNGSTPPTNQMTPMALTQSMFSYWRGTIKYRFRFICTKYHKGRVIISYDPQNDMNGTAPDYYNTSFSRIIDISEEPDVIIEVPWMAKQSWLKTETLMTSELISPYTPSAPAVKSIDPNKHNGKLSLRVFTEQTSPVASADIMVVYSVMGGNDLQFAGPREVPNLTNFEIQSGDSENMMGNPSVITIRRTIDNEHLNLVNMGEKVHSLRTLLRRSNFYRYRASYPDNTSLIAFNTIKTPRIPVTMGYDPNGYDIANDIVGLGTHRFNYVQTGPFQLLINCFVGYRGSMHWKYNVSGRNPIASIYAFRTDETRSNEDGFSTTIPTSASGDYISYAYAVDLPCGSAGLSLTNQHTQASVEVSVPMYNRFRFQSTDPANTVIGTSIDDSDIDSIKVISKHQPVASTADETRGTGYEIYYSIGTDFTFLWFLNVPTFQLVSSMPTPA